MVVDGVELPCTIPTYTYVGGEFLERRAKNQLRLKAVKTPKVAKVVKFHQPSTPTMPLLEFWLVQLPMLIQRVVWTNSQYEILKFGPIALDGGPIECCVFLSCRGPNQPFWPGWQPYSYSPTKQHSHGTQRTHS